MHGFFCFRGFLLLSGMFMSGQRWSSRCQVQNSTSHNWINTSHTSNKNWRWNKSACYIYTSKYYAPDTYIERVATKTGRTAHHEKHKNELKKKKKIKSNQIKSKGEESKNKRETHKAKKKCTLHPPTPPTNQLFENKGFQVTGKLFTKARHSTPWAKYPSQ